MRRLSFGVIALALGLAGCSTMSAMMGGDRNEGSATTATSASTEQPASANCADQGAQPSGQAASADCPATSAEQPAPQPQ